MSSATDEVESVIFAARQLSAEGGQSDAALRASTVVCTHSTSALHLELK